MVAGGEEIVMIITKPGSDFYPDFGFLLNEVHHISCNLMQQTTLEVPQTKDTAISTYRQMGRHKGSIWCLLFPVYSVEA